MAQKVIPVDDAIRAVDDLMPETGWAKPPSWVTSEIVRQSADGFIGLSEAHTILSSAMESRLLPRTNKGLADIKRRWKLAAVWPRSATP